jgi:hypothetical protein
MKSMQLTTFAAVAFGLIAFLVLRMAFPDINTNEFASIIGLVAVFGGVVGMWLDRRRDRK